MKTIMYRSQALQTRSSLHVFTDKIEIGAEKNQVIHNKAIRFLLRHLYGDLMFYSHFLT